MKNNSASPKDITGNLVRFNELKGIGKKKSQLSIGISKNENNYKSRKLSFDSLSFGAWSLSVGLMLMQFFLMIGLSFL